MRQGEWTTTMSRATVDPMREDRVFKDKFLANKQVNRLKHEYRKDVELSGELAVLLQNKKWCSGDCR
jgi:hypothetical protein